MTDATNDEARVAEIRARADAATAYNIDDAHMGTADDISAWIDDRRAKEELARTDVPWLLDQRDRYKAAVDAVLGLHRRIEQRFSASTGANHIPTFLVSCTCGNPWPCPTVNAVTEALGGEL